MSPRCLRMEILGGLLPIRKIQTAPSEPLSLHKLERKLLGLSLSPLGLSQLSARLRLAVDCVAAGTLIARSRHGKLLFNSNPSDGLGSLPSPLPSHSVSVCASAICLPLSVTRTTTPPHHPVSPLPSHAACEGKLSPFTLRSGGGDTEFFPAPQIFLFHSHTFGGSVAL